MSESLTNKVPELVSKLALSIPVIKFLVSCNHNDVFSDITIHDTHIETKVTYVTVGGRYGDQIRIFG